MNCCSTAEVLSQQADGAHMGGRRSRVSPSFPPSKCSRDIGWHCAEVRLLCTYSIPNVQCQSCLCKLISLGAASWKHGYAVFILELNMCRAHSGMCNMLASRIMREAVWGSAWGWGRLTLGWQMWTVRLIHSSRWKVHHRSREAESHPRCISNTTT